ncbi:MAG: hypothetical protein IV100_07415 [Myxococcales bacterium]|nr:hypothetical protein [Myxococcales bacterium]
MRSMSNSGEGQRWFSLHGVALAALAAGAVAACSSTTTEPSDDTVRLDVPTGETIETDGNVTVGCKDDDDCLTAGAALTPCSTSACNLDTGTCETRPLADGTACQDPCIAGDGVCASGICDGGTPKCDDGDPCTTEECAGDGTCSTTPVEGCCTPTCGDATCGDDGCGGSCGACLEGQACAFGQCVAIPVDACLGEADVALICSADARDAAIGCAVSCRIPGATCGDGCDLSAGLSDGCAVCFAGFVDCAKAACKGACTPGGGDCKACAVDACGAALTICMGEPNCPCEPACTDKDCGDDGCGGTCGTCESGETCSAAGVCETECVPSCTDKDCGDDGCGGICGTCAEGKTCSAAGVCETDCVPACTDKDCGDDGCGGTCGTCAEGKTCSAAGVCETDCVPACTDKDCGDDGCGGTCGTCAEGKTCSAAGLCVTDCVPTCDGRICGDDGCGGECGVCPGGQSCSAAGACETICVPQCDGKACGDNGCGGSCGTCNPGNTCSPNGACVPDCVPQCDGKACGDNGCGGSCGTCDPGNTCSPNGACVPDCVPQCGGKACGDNGCGGSCGTCDPGNTCSPNGACVPDCVPQCEGKECGDDGCGGACGTCGLTSTCSPAGACVLNCGNGTCGAGENCTNCASDCGCGSDQTCTANGLCVPKCGDGTCGPGEGCGNCAADCGCSGASVCTAAGVCCAPQCANKECGDDQCGGSCGACNSNFSCSESGTCVPDCGNGVCGENENCAVCPDDCACLADETCTGGTCVVKCGDGTCGPDESCNDCVLDCGCNAGEICSPGGTCDPDECNGLTAEGCCVGKTLATCDAGKLVTTTCATSCGWDPAANTYACNGSGADPSGTFPLLCEGACQPDCAGKACGLDGCGGSCGDCGLGNECTANGQCAPTCGNGVCALDESCKTCAADCACGQAETCNADGVCAPTVPCGEVDSAGCCDGNLARWCSNGTLTETPCPGTCGWSAGDARYACGFEGTEPSGTHSMACPVVCAPNCNGRECGDDGCGGTCGSCGSGEQCTALGECVLKCGDGLCSLDEDCVTCPGDCGCTAGKLCRPDGQCVQDNCGSLTVEGCCLGQVRATCDFGSIVMETCPTTCGWNSESAGYQCGSSGADPSGTHPMQCPGACQPDCTNKVCGSDGCGGSCGVCEGATECTAAGQCAPTCGNGTCGGGENCSTCPADCGCPLGERCGPDAICIPGVDCGQVTSAGCCDGNTLHFCDQGSLTETLCQGGCGWFAPGGYYGCAGQGADPSGQNPLYCPGACVPSCQGKVCGDDGCGGSCGQCGGGTECTAAGQCAPTCGNGTCGADEDCVSCPGDCGCTGSDVCDPTGFCAPLDQCGGITAEGCCDLGTLATCAGGQVVYSPCTSTCGWDPNGLKYACEFTGADPSGTHPIQCGTCTPSCDGAQCGDDGCGGSCGTCGGGTECTPDRLCKPPCGNGTCGQGESCSTCPEDCGCPNGQVCSPEGACQIIDNCGPIGETGCCDSGRLRYCNAGQIIEEDCAASCGWSPLDANYGCGFTGADPSGQNPLYCPGSCVPLCDGKQCGPDGCGGDCGSCAPGQECSPAGACTDPKMDIGGFKLVQTSASWSYTFPQGTMVTPGSVVVVGRQADRLAFNTYFPSMPASTIYLNSAGTFPQINGDETFSLVAPDGAVLDGPTIVHSTAAGKRNYQRKVPVGAANLASSWINVTTPTPGTASADAASPSVFISEWADPSTFNYEFVEIMIVGGADPTGGN